MNDFELLRHRHLHHVACEPDGPRVRGLNPSDIVLHLPVLEWFASHCRHVTELGTREGHSTTALVSGCGKGPGGPDGEVHSYDVQAYPFVAQFAAMELPCRWHFHPQNTVNPAVAAAAADTDMLFVDTLHTGEHVRKELSLWGRKARKYLAFHDTFTCGPFDRSGPDPSVEGILPAIDEFLARFPGEYRTVYRTDHNNGLWVIERFPESSRDDWELAE